MRNLKKYNFQKRRKELEEASVNDNLLLAKSSLNIALLPENDDDKNMASLLALRSSKTVEENQSQTRSDILNSPALPSSKGLINTFGGLKKEESLKKAMQLTRNSLGINLRNDKNEVDYGVNAVSVSKQSTKLSDTNVTKDEVVKDENKTKHEIKTNDESVKVFSLVGDYSSSGDSSD